MCGALGIIPTVAIAWRLSEIIIYNEPGHLNEFKVVCSTGWITAGDIKHTVVLSACVMKKD
jgi:hypothetical protein